MARIYNFSAGPATLPLDVLEVAQAELTDYRASGMSIMECSHRGKEYQPVQEEAEANLRELLGLTDAHAVLFLQGGASMQFAMLPMNFLAPGRSADYVRSGHWADRAIREARTLGAVHLAADCADESPARVPTPDALRLSADAAYVHLTSNETISGAQWQTFPDTASPLVADMSSDILSRPMDASRFKMIYAGAQKNLGPAGVTLVIIDKTWAAQGAADIPAFLRYQKHIDAGGLLNTPPCFSVYIVMLVTRWLKKEGLNAMFMRNREKADLLYQAIDASDFYRGSALPACRSNMNVTFRLPDETLEARFIETAAKQGMSGLKGHRSAGGIRASIYNAFPVDGVRALVDLMRDFERRMG